MTRSAAQQPPLFDAWSLWEQLPEPVRQQALDALAAICLETLDPSRMETNSDDAHDN
jgi:hypothetical protein